MTLTSGTLGSTTPDVCDFLRSQVDWQFGNLKFEKFTCLIWLPSSSNESRALQAFSSFVLRVLALIIINTTILPAASFFLHHHSS